MAGFEQVLQQFSGLQQIGGATMDALILLLARFYGFGKQAPIFNRQDVPPQFKSPVYLVFGLALLTNPAVQISAQRLTDVTILQFLTLVVTNILFGVFLGFAMRIVFEAIAIAGGLITSQIGLQMANIVDPISKQQNPVLAPLFNALAALVFIYIGGIELLLKTFEKSFTLIPLHIIEQNWFELIDIYRWIQLSNDILPLAVLLAAPFYISSILMDAILGIVNKTAQQIPVFQLSHSLKPLLGMITFFVTVPTLFPIMRHIMITMIVRL